MKATMKQFKYSFLILFTLSFFSVSKGYTQVFNLGNSVEASGWYKLGTLNLPQQGLDAEFRIISGNGYNASLDQQGECVIHFRTSNAVSQIGGFLGSGNFYNTGRTKIVNGIRFIQITPSLWDVYANLVKYTGLGAVLNMTSVQGSWTRDFTLVSLPATTPYLDLSEELIEQSKVSFLDNVGIGTTSPREKLSVNGNIRAQEIKVETQNWPDYVFDKDYDLQSLPLLEQYLLKNKHLPDMPSAKEVESTGQNLGEMNSKLLKNIEELTLHLIEKDKQISAQETINQQQEIEIRKLKETVAEILKKLNGITPLQ